MNFKEGLPIYMQIAERLSDEVLAGVYPPEERVPGVREYSANLGVNVNTIVKAFDVLSQQGVIAARRGMGYYVTADAPQRILSERKQQFRHQVLPELFRQMQLLGVSIDELVDAYHQAAAASGE